MSQGTISTKKRPIEGRQNSKKEEEEEVGLEIGWFKFSHIDLLWMTVSWKGSQPQVSSDEEENEWLMKQ